MLEHSRGCDVIAIPEDFTSGGAREACKHSEEGGLSRPVSASQDESRAIMDRDVDVAQHGLGISHARDIVQKDARGWRLEWWHLEERNKQILTPDNLQWAIATGDDHSSYNTKNHRQTKPILDYNLLLLH